VTVFPVSGVETPLWLPFLVALVVSFFTSMGGVSGAFLLLPFQVSVLGFTTPGVTPTNLIFNIVAIPGGVWRYLREGRMLWPLAAVVVAGTLPGVVAGGLIRIRFLPDPTGFKLFVGLVLLYIGVRLALDLLRPAGARGGDSGGTESQDWSVAVEETGWRRLAFRFRGERHACSVPALLGLSLLVGAVGGIYGVGGGAIIAPFLVSVFRLPVHTIAGATLLGTFVTSVAGVAFFEALAPHYAERGLAVAPDWPLGLLFGAGGTLGMYLGARAQRFVPARWIKLILLATVLAVALRYLAPLLRGL
jgi:uncharacterized membrane protein YfcA